MRTRSGLRLRALGVATLLATSTREARAQSLPEFPACTAPGNQAVDAVAPDGMGGSFIFWRDARAAISRLFVLHLTPAGQLAPGWTIDGKPVCPTSGNQFAARAVADGQGGVCVVWEEQRNGSTDIRATRLDEFGRVRLPWPQTGRLVCGALGQQHEPALCSDGRGGFFVAWADHRVPLDADIAIQHLDANGALPAAWPADGQLLCDVSGMQWRPGIVPDGVGGVIVVWEDWRNGIESDIYTQHVAPNLASLWGPNGLLISAAPSSQERPSLAPDGTGGAYFVWQDLRGAYYDIYVGRIDGAGNQDWGWPFEDGLPLCAAVGGQFAPQIVADGDRSAIVVWFDGRSGNYDIYAQKITAHGAVGAGWNADGLGLCTAAGDQLDPQLTSDGAGGAFAVWTDRRHAGNSDVGAARILSTGTIASCWPVNGLEVCTASGDQTGPVLAPNGRGGIVVAWTDARGGQQSDVYAAVVERTAIEDFAAWPANGVAVCDAPGDQLAAATAPVGSVAVGDGTSGVFVVWQDQRPSDHGRLRVQRIGPNGAAVPGWPPDGVPLCDVASLQQGASVTFDGQGGVIAVWEDGRNPTGYDLYAQRVTGAGTLAPGWPAAGLPVCTMTGNQFEARPASDGQGGAYIVWRDARDTFSIDIYASRLTSSGSVAPGWPLNGRVFCAAVGNQHTVDIAADGRGNVFFAWIDERLRNTPRIYATFVNASGTVGVGFPTDGLRLTNTARPQKALRLLSDNDGGVVFVWLDGRRGGQDVFANRITPLLPRWGSDDVWLGRALQATTLDAAADGTGGAIVTWTSIANGVPNLMAQHVQGDGAIAAGWPNGSLRVAPSLRPQLFPNIAADGAGGAYLTWVDVRRGEADVFAQHWRGDGRLGADGGSGGVPVCIAPGTQLAPRIVTDASGCGAIAVWQDGRAGDMDVYATRLGPQRAATDIALETPAARSLAAFPNPFRARTQLAFMAPGRGALQLEVFDVAGRRVQAWNVAGLHGNQRIFWDGRDAHGTPVATGVYLVRLRGAGVDATAKLVRSR